MDLKKITQFAVKNKLPLNSNIFVYFTFLVIAILTLYPLFGTGFACADDLANYTNTRFGKEFLSAKFIAEMTGRFYYLIVAPFHNLPYEIDDLFVIKLFQVIPILICLFLFYRIVLILTKSKEVSSLFVLLFFVIAQYSHHTSLFLNYPFYFTFSFSLILSAYLLLHRFQVTRKKRYLLFSALLFGFGLLFYEAFILFIGFAALSILYNSIQEKKRRIILIKQVLLQLLPYIVIVIGYGAAYIIYSHYHQSEYAGTMMTGNAITIGAFFQVLWKLSYSAFPLTEYDSDFMHDFFRYKSELIEGYRNVIPYLFYHAHVEWIIKSILVFILSYYTLIRIPKIPYKILLMGILLALMLTFFPHIPLALTQKYTYYVVTQGMLGYITTFFSLFGVILFLTIISTLAINFTNSQTLPRHGIALVISVVFVFCSFLTDFSNYYVAQDIHQANVRMRTVDEMIKSDPFKNIPQSSNIYSNQLWDNPFYMAGGVTEQGFLWNYYILCKSGIIQNIIRDEKEFLRVTKSSQDPGYRIVYKQASKSDDALLAIAQLGIPLPTDSIASVVSNKVLIVFYSKYKQFSVSFRQLENSQSEKVKIKVNHITDEITPGNNIEFTIYNTKFNQAATIFTIESNSIDIRSIKISNLISPESKIFYL